MASELPADAPAPRLCHLVKWPDFDGYGFNLHAEKAKTGQFIGKVDEGSPAERAGLREGDRIIEVNGVNIANENHRQVVERIKAMVNETKLLVLDEAADKWYKERKLVVKGTQANVIYKKTPATQFDKSEEVETRHSSNGNAEDTTEKAMEKVAKEEKPVSKTEESKKQSQIEENGSDKKTEIESQNHALNGKMPPDSKKEEIKEMKEIKETVPVKVEAQNGSATNGSGTIINNNNNGITDIKKKTNNVSQGASPQSNTGSSSSATGKDDLNLNMSAAQMREMLANRKKRDPRKQNLDMKEKYQIVQQM